MARRILVPRGLQAAFEKIGIPSQIFIEIQHFFSELSAASELTGSFKVVREISAEYTPQQSDDEIFVDTDGGNVIVNLPEGPEGKNYRIVNVGTSDNRVLLEPVSGVKLLGEELGDYLADSEAAIFTYSITYGWY